MLLSSAFDGSNILKYGFSGQCLRQHSYHRAQIKYKADRGDGVITKKLYLYTYYRMSQSFLLACVGISTMQGRASMPCTTQPQRRAVQAAAILCLLSLVAGTAADSWMHTRGRGQVKLPSPANRYLKSSHSHASGAGLSHSDLHRNSRYAVHRCEHPIC